MLSWTMDEFTSLNRVISVCDLSIGLWMSNGLNS